MGLINEVAFTEAKKARKEKMDWISNRPEVTLLPESIARGKVVKILIYKAEPSKVGDVTEVSVLELDPGAEILEHEHTTDREVYYVGNLQLTCEAGQSHSYENSSAGPEIIVAVKQAVKL